MKIKLVTLYDEKFKTIGEVSSRVMAKYCNERGYEFTCYHHLPDPSRGPQWNKTRIVQQELGSCDWLVWMDADSIPVNFNFSIGAMIDQLPERDLIISGDDGGLCFGIFAVRNCAWAIQFFQTLWFCGQMDREYGKRYQEVVKYDQTTVKALYENFPSISSRIAVIGQNWVCNPHSDFSHDSFAVHYWATGWFDATDLDGIARKMRLFEVDGWVPAVHRDLKIVTCADAKMQPVLETSLVNNRRQGYDPVVYNVNGTLTFGNIIVIPGGFPDSNGETGRIPFKPAVIRRGLEDAKQFIAYLDADAFAIRRFDEVNTLDYDVGVTMRRPEERGATHWPTFYGFLNAGVMFFNHTPEAFKFLDLWESELPNSRANSDQEALNLLVLQATDLSEYNKVFVWNGIRIKVFSCDQYNFFYWPENPKSATKIVHCKTDRRMALTDWGQRDW